MGNFGKICGHLPGFCPLLKHGFGQKIRNSTNKKPSIYAGLRVLRFKKAHLPTFFLKLL